MKIQKKDMLLEVKNLTVHFHIAGGIIKAVNNINFSLKKGETLGIIGESGCGKSVMVKSLIQIVPIPPGKIVSGEVLFRYIGGNGKEKINDLLKFNANSEEMRRIRGKHISIIFQDPMSSFSPVHTIGNQIMEAILIHTNLNKKEAREYAIELLNKVGISQAERTIDTYSYELSGGMCQRAMIAMALSCSPQLLIADEPTTAVDVTLQAQILELIQNIQNRLNMSIIFITHDLGVIAEIAHKVEVIYLGSVVEYASVEELFDNQLHPYTKALWRSIPSMKTKSKILIPIKGSIPSYEEFPEGCVFKTRCTEKVRKCDIENKIPDLIEVSPQHFVRCFRYM